MLMRTWQTRAPAALMVPIFAAVVLLIGAVFFLVTRLTAPAAFACLRSPAPTASDGRDYALAAQSPAVVFVH